MNGNERERPARSERFGANTRRGHSTPMPLPKNRVFLQARYVKPCYGVGHVGMCPGHGLGEGVADGL